MKCSKCELEAVFDSPQPMCARHWAEWWVDGLDLPADQKLIETEVTLKKIENKE